MLSGSGGGVLFAESRCSGSHVRPDIGRAASGRRAEVAAAVLGPPPVPRDAWRNLQKENPRLAAAEDVQLPFPRAGGWKPRGTRRAPSVFVGLGSWFTSSPPLRKACELQCKVLLGAYVRFFNPSSSLLVPSQAGRALLSAGL